MQNAAGYFVQPADVFNNWNLTDVFGEDFTIPSSLVSDAWANVSLFQSSEPCTLLHPSFCMALVPHACCAPVIGCLTEAEPWVCS